MLDSSWAEDFVTGFRPPSIIHILFINLTIEEFYSLIYWLSTAACLTIIYVLVKLVSSILKPSASHSLVLSLVYRL